MLLLCSTNICEISKISTLIGKPETAESLIWVLVSYLFGIVCHAFGVRLFSFFKRFIWKIPPRNYKNYTNSQMFVLIRELSPANFTYVETWLALRGMSFNLAFSIGVLSLVFISKGVSLFTNCGFQFQWLLAALISIGFSIVFIYRAKKFNDWYHDDCISTIEMLHLEQKALNQAGNTSNSTEK